MIGAGSLLLGVGLAPIATAAIPAVFAGTVALGVGFAALNVGYFTILQRRTAAGLQGRVFAATETVLNLPFAGSIGLGAVLVGRLGFRPMYLVNAIVLAACGVFLLFTKVGPAEAGDVVAEERLRSPEGIVPPS